MHSIYHPHTHLDTIHCRVSLGDIFVFDIDGTLTKPNEHISPEWAQLLKKLSDHNEIIILTARDHHTIHEHIIRLMPEDTNWGNWYLASANGGQIYQYQKGQTQWSPPISLYEMPERDRKAIQEAFWEMRDTCAIPGLHPEANIEDRITNLTIVIYPRNIYDPQEEKYIKTPAYIRDSIDPDKALRKSVVECIHQKLPQIAQKYEWHIGGATSIDVKDPSATKGPNLDALIDTHQWNHRSVVFFGDEVTTGGDQCIPHARHPYLTAIEVASPDDTYYVLQSFFS